MALNDKKIKMLEQSTGHSVFGPSSLKRIMLCPGSVTASLHAPIPEESEYAAEGTLLHSYCEDAMTKRPDNPILYVNEQDWTSERKVLVIDALNYVLDIMDKHAGEVTVGLEAKGTLTEWGLPEIYGTMDVVIKSDSRIDVIDYKFGFGIQVFAENNPQCAAYLASQVPFDNGSRPLQKLYTHINQPTLNHYDDWEVPWEDLCSLILVDIHEALKEAKSVNPRYTPSMEACRWCNAKMFCDHRKVSVKEKAQMVAKAARNPANIRKEDWKKFLDAADDLQQAIKDVRLYAHSEIKSGRGFPGYKLVAGRSQRKFLDDAKGKALILENLNESEAYVKKLISLAQAEKKVPGLKKNEEWTGNIIKPTGKPVLVPEQDKREALEFTMQNEFTEDARKIADAGSTDTGVVIEGMS